MIYKTLRTAALSGNINETKYFLDKGFDPNQKVGYGGGTLLQFVIQYKLTDVAVLLMQYGAKVNTQDNFGATPLHEAAKTGNKVLVEKLLAKGANAFACDSNRITPEILAARNGHRELAFRLTTNFIFKYPNLFFSSISSSDLYQTNEDQNEPVDLSKTGPYATKFKL